MIQELLLKGLRKTYRNITGKKFVGYTWPQESEWESTNSLLTKAFSDKKPCFVGRIGTVECAIINNYLTVHSTDSYFKRCINYITDEKRLPFWDTGKPFYELQNNAGFFSKKGINIKDIERFAELYLQEIPMMDICGRFSYPEKFLPFKKECQMVQLESLYPFFSLKPWTQVLEGQKVLVIHPFKKSILSQYNNNRQVLFKNPNMLPKFKLDVIQAVQSIAGEECSFNDWFEALDYMKDEISKRDFDVLIVGCGAYGLPLAAFGKKLGKKSLHLGGGTQLLFGIKGKRWEENYHKNDTRFADLFNEYWIYPSQTERPQYAHNVEGGCYW